MDTTCLDQNLETCDSERLLSSAQQQIITCEKLKDYEKLMAQMRLEDIASNIDTIIDDDICKRNPAISICKYLNQNSEFPYDISECQMTEEDTVNCISNSIYFSVLEIPITNFSDVLNYIPESVISKIDFLRKNFPTSFKDIVAQDLNVLSNTSKEFENRVAWINKLGNVKTYKKEIICRLFLLNSKTLKTLISTSPTYPAIKQADLEKIFNSPVGLEVEIYLNKIEFKIATEPTGEFLLNKDEEVMLFKALKMDKDQFEDEEQMNLYKRRIQNVIVKCNEGLIHSRMKRYGLSGDEHFSDGQLGLMIALPKFDYTRGKFSTYATFWIDQSLRRSIYQGDYDEISKPNNLGAMVIRYKKISSRLIQTLKREPTLEEVVAYCKEHGIKMVTEFSLAPMLAAENSVSIDASRSDDGDEDDDFSLHNLLTEDPITRKKENERLIKIDAIMRILPPRDLDILIRYSKGKTMKQIGEYYNVTPERIRQILARISYSIKKYQID